MADSLTFSCRPPILLTRLLNACHHFPGFVYEGARLNETTQTIEIDVRPRRGSRPRCSGCGNPARGYDTLRERRSSRSGVTPSCYCIACVAWHAIPAGSRWRTCRGAVSPLISGISGFVSVPSGILIETGQPAPRRKAIRILSGASACWRSVDCLYGQCVDVFTNSPIL